MKALGDIASIIRSKNAGPFIVTFDIFFDDEKTFEAVKAAGLINRASVCERYGVSDNELLGFDFYSFARAIKFSLRRPVSAGGPSDSDVYGAQQHAPLVDMPALKD
ncbi:MAG: DUF4387 domain-containing protein [Gammaproteobacteria bacterium]